MLEVVEVELVPGLVVGGRWRLESPIGRGGFGVVWSAVDVSTGEPRALKCLTEEGASDAKRQERLRREARAMSSITHPHVARVFGVEELPAGTPFIVMELLRGGTLHNRLARGRMSVPEACGVLVRIADALRAVHARGIIHRDLKPANVFILDERTVKVLDFGIAKDLSTSERHNLTTTGTTLGTLSYMAPEQIFGEPNLDGRCDVWALGVIAHECLTLRRPTDAEEGNQGQILKKILDGSFPRLSALMAGCPPDLDELVARMLSRVAAERPTSDEVFTTLGRHESAASLARSALTMSQRDAPLLAQTLRDERFASSQRMPSDGAPTVLPSTVVPSTVVPSTVAAPTVVPSTVVPSTVAAPTVVPSTVIPSTVVAPTGPNAATNDARALALAATLPALPPVSPMPPVKRESAPATSPARTRAEESTVDNRARAGPSWARGLAIAVAVLVGCVVVAVTAWLVVHARGRGSDGAAHVATEATAISRTIESEPPAPIASKASIAASSATASPAGAAAPSAPATPASSKPTNASRTPATPRPSSVPGAGTSKGSGDPPISEQRF